MAGFDIYNSEGHWIGNAETDDPQVAAVMFLLDKGPTLWAIDIVENEDGSISASYDGKTVSLIRIIEN
jgi:hypothetical protein